MRESFNTLNQEITQELSWERWSSSKRKRRPHSKSQRVLENEDKTQYRDDLQKLQTEWKEIGFTSRDDDKLWEQFKEKSVTPFIKNCSKSKKPMKLNVKPFLKELDKLKGTNDWKNTTEKIQALQKQWSEAFPVSRKAIRKQGQTYKEICDHFFNRRREHQKEMRSNQKDNLKEKKLLIEKVKRLHSETNWKHSLPKVKDLQEEWKKTGPVPKKVSNELWKEFQEACSVIYDKRRAENEQLEKEFEANAEKKNELLEQLKAVLKKQTFLQLVMKFKKSKNFGKKLAKCHAPNKK